MKLIERAEHCLKHNTAASKTELIRGLIAENKQLQEAIDDYRDDYKATMSTTCDDGAVHCSCVPGLKLALKTVSAALLESHKGPCTYFGTKRDCCLPEELGESCHLNPGQFKSCKFYGPCVCNACKISREVVE